MSDTRNQITEVIQRHWPFQDRPPRRVVIKVGSNVLSLKSGGLDSERISGLVDEIAGLRKKGCEIILVSSGAVAAGRGMLGLAKRPTALPELQAVAAIGQGALIEEYSRQFRRHNLLVAQMLLNREDMDDRRRYLNARHALGELIQRSVIPIINENDTVNIDELKFGDNDMLSAMVAAKMDADLLLIMSNIPGLMTGHPRNDPAARLIPVVHEVTGEQDALVDKTGSDHGTGGMKTKLMAARHATSFGVTCVIVDGMKKGKIERVYTGRFEGTLFLATGHRRSGSARRHWLTSTRPRGEIIIDDGAARALIEQGRSLLPVGIRQTRGEYAKGDVVGIYNLRGQELAHGIVNYDAEDIEKIKGLQGTEITKLFGEIGYLEAVHRNNLVLLGADHSQL